MAAVFSNFADAFQNRQISDISFYVIYMLLITLCLTAFQTAVSGLEEKMGLLTEFIRAAGAGIFYGYGIFVRKRRRTGFLQPDPVPDLHCGTGHHTHPAPGCKYLCDDLRARQPDRGRFSLGTAGLIRKAVTWALHGLLACVAGINIIQGLLAPAVDSVKRSTLTRTAEAVPWVGDLMAGRRRSLPGP